jgi:hypothetical protein
VEASARQATSDQRHRALVNGVWDAGYGFQLSAIYFFGSGERRRTNFGSDLRDEGGTSASSVRRGFAVTGRSSRA